MHIRTLLDGTSPLRDIKTYSSYWSGQAGDESIYKMLYMDQFICKEIHLIKADVDGKMLKVFVHNWDEEYCLKYHPSYKN